MNEHLKALHDAGYRVTVQHDNVRLWSVFCYKGRRLEYWGHGSSEERALNKAHDALFGAEKIPHVVMSEETRRMLQDVQRQANQALKGMGYRR